MLNSTRQLRFPSLGSGFGSVIHVTFSTPGQDSVVLVLMSRTPNHSITIQRQTQK